MSGQEGADTSPEAVARSCAGLRDVSREVASSMPATAGAMAAAAALIEALAAERDALKVGHNPATTLGPV
jgi:hypothetical protein